MRIIKTNIKQAKIIFVDQKDWPFRLKGTHCVKSVRIRSHSGPHFPAFTLNTDQNDSENGHFSRSVH